MSGGEHWWYHNPEETLREENEHLKSRLKKAETKVEKLSNQVCRKKEKSRKNIKK